MGHRGVKRNQRTLIAMESSHGTSTKLERKTVEKNRRNQMKGLYAKLDSLLPSSTSPREGATLPLSDRLSEVANYIKGMQEKLERMKERKRQLMASNEAADNSKLPKIEVQNRGSNLYAIQITSSPDDQAMFYEAVRAVEEEGGEVLNAQFSTTDGKTFHTIYALVGDFKCRIETGKLMKRLKELGWQGGVRKKDS